MTLSELETACALMRELIGDVEVMHQRYGGYSLNGYTAPVSGLDVISYKSTMVAIIA